MSSVELEAIARRYEEDHRTAQRDMWRDLGFSFLRLVACVAVGMYLVGMAFHVTDVRTGMIYLYTGYFWWVVSVAITSMNAYRRGQLRGDWY